MRCGRFVVQPPGLKKQQIKKMDITEQSEQEPHVDIVPVLSQ